MKAALILCPFFTNGDYPALGLASINGALREAGHETACFDFCWLAYKEGQGEYHLMRQFFGVGLVEDELVFVLNPEFGLYFLYREDEPDFKWKLSDDPQIKQAAAMLYLGLKRMAGQWAHKVLAVKPDAVFFSTYASNVFVSLYLAKQIRKSRPEIPIVFGGPGSSLPEMQEFVIGTGLADAVVAGEGELTVSELCSDFERNLSSGVPGLALRKDDTVAYEPRPLAKDLDSLPLPDYAGFPMAGCEYNDYNINRPNRYLTPFFKGLPVASTRGCVNRCAYCSETAYWTRYRQRKVESVIGQIKDLNGRFGENHFLFNESAFNGNPGWVEKFCEKAASLDFKPSFSSLLIADRSTDAKLAALMYRAGFRYVTLGVETFSRSIRERMRKGKGGDEIFDSIIALTSAGINVKANLLVGFPGETEEEFNTSLGYVERWAAMSKNERGPGSLYWDAGHTVRLEAYSEMYHNPEKYGIKIRPRELPIPESLGYLSGPLANILLRWSMPLDREKIKMRARRIEQASQKANNA